MAEQKILCGASSGDLLTYPRGALSVDGRPVRAQAAASPTPKVRIGTPSTPMPATFSDSRVFSPTYTATTSAAAAEGATSISLSGEGLTAAGAGISYLIVDASTGEIIEVVALASGASVTTLHLREPLPCAIASGSTVYSWFVAATLTEAEIADPGEGIAIWQATVLDEVHEWVQTFQIVRRLPQWTLTPTKLTTRWPQIHSLRPRTDATLQELIDSAADDDVMSFLAIKGIKIEDVISYSALEEFHALACLHRCTLTNADVDPGVKADIKARYDEKRKELLVRSDWWTQPQVETPAPRPPNPPAVDVGTMVTR